MTLFQILVFVLIGLLVGRWGGTRWRAWLMLVGSVLAIFWLQPGIPIRYLDFWLPTATLVLTAMVWGLTRPAGQPHLTRPDLIAVAVMLVVVLGIGLSRYSSPLCCLTTTRPPPFQQILLAMLVTAVGIALLLRTAATRPWMSTVFVVLLLGLFAVLKTAPLSTGLSAALRGLMQQNIALASALDIRWLGFSYVTFRLIHVLRDRVSGRLPDISLAEMVTFTIFFPAYVAGPIDRVQRFTPDLRADYRLGSRDLRTSGERLVWGIFKKFVIADTLALIALNAQNASQVNSTFWMWVILYAYAFLIYFDFSGYTDVAIGLGMLMGIRLPENFNRPYLQHNLTQFWNTWHMTLAQWFRAYYFNPLTRSLRASPRHIPVQWIILIGQFSTMVLIGLWHGVTWNFAIWGAWHGLGLFAHNRWNEFVRVRLGQQPLQPRTQRLLGVGGILLTFNFVALGWVWFSLPTPELSLRVFSVLFGAG
jgi:alginate O-acetyltransferase complex protein AlgI